MSHPIDIRAKTNLFSLKVEKCDKTCNVIKSVDINEKISSKHL